METIECGKTYVITVKTCVTQSILVALAEGRVGVVKPSTTVSEVTNDFCLTLTSHFLRVKLLPLFVQGIPHSLDARVSTSILDGTRKRNTLTL